MSNVDLRVMQGGEVVADIIDYDGPIPRKGDYVFHPALEGDGIMGTAGTVASVTYLIYSRPRQLGVTWFVRRRGRPYVEIQFEN